MSDYKRIGIKMRDQEEFYVEVKEESVEEIFNLMTKAMVTGRVVAFTSKVGMHALRGENLDDVGCWYE